MPKFSVTAVTKDGEEYRETVEAASRFEVYRDMRTRGDRVISLVGSASGILGRAQNYLDRFGTVSVDEKVSFARTMAAMLAAGLSTTRALSVIERQTRNRTFKAVLSDVIGGVKRGSA
ncbi:type II secretion system F family protein, partial [Patescibacteria group bacterium]|nr:type II secretion system F family protein [Patescibacteria group bacterium]